MASCSVLFQAAVSRPRLRALAPRRRGLPSRSSYQSERRLWDRCPDATALSSTPSGSRDWTAVSPNSLAHAYGFGVSCSPPLRSPSQEGARSSGSPMVQSLAYPPPGGSFGSRMIQPFPLARLSAAWESYLQRQLFSQSLSLVSRRKKAWPDRGWFSQSLLLAYPPQEGVAGPRVVLISRSPIHRRRPCPQVVRLSSFTDPAAAR